MSSSKITIDPDTTSESMANVSSPSSSKSKSCDEQGNGSKSKKATTTNPLWDLLYNRVNTEAPLNPDEPPRKRSKPSAPVDQLLHGKEVPTTSIPPGVPQQLRFLERFHETDTRERPETREYTQSPRAPAVVPQSPVQALTPRPPFPEPVEIDEPVLGEDPQEVSLTIDLQENSPTGLKKDVRQETTDKEDRKVPDGPAEEKKKPIPEIARPPLGWKNRRKAGRPRRTFKVSNHEETEEDGSERTCLWNGCKQVFTQDSAFFSHVDGHLRADSNRLRKCHWEGCDHSKPFNAMYKIQAHVRSHTKEKPFKCEVPKCNKSYSRNENLTIHMRTHTGEKPFKCKICGKGFTNSSDRGFHVNRVHSEKKHHLCLICKKSYTDHSSLRKHFKKNHLEQFPEFQTGSHRANTGRKNK